MTTTTDTRTTDTAPAPTWTPAPGKALLLRTTSKDGRSHGGYQWPRTIGATATAPDWDPTPICGYGLHGLLWGTGSGSLLSRDPDALWWVIEVDTDTLIDLDGKVKAPSAVIVHVGDRATAVDLITRHAPNGSLIVCGTATAGDHGTATAGYDGTATAGDDGTATAGNRGTATAGDDGTATAGYRGTATAGDDGTATAGDDGTATAGNRGTATAGNRGTATAGNRGTATAGNHGTATAGDDGTATAGDHGTATAGYCGTATAGYCGMIIIKWWDRDRCRYRLAYGEVGIDGIEPNIPYRVQGGRLFPVATET